MFSLLAEDPRKAAEGMRKLRLNAINNESRYWRKFRGRYAEVIDKCPRSWRKFRGRRAEALKNNFFLLALVAEDPRKPGGRFSYFYEI